MRLSLLYLLTNSKIPAHICQNSYQSQLSVGMRQLQYRKNNDDDDDDDLTNKCKKNQQKQLRQRPKASGIVVAFSDYYELAFIAAS